MERHFDEELRDLKQKLIEMSSIVEEMIVKSITALQERKINLVDDVIKKENSVNMMQIEIDDAALKLIALHQPAAGDLRLIVSVIKINSDLERIADLTVNISQCTQKLLEEPPLKPLIDIPHMAQLSQKMVKDSIDAFVNKDSHLAKKVCEGDDLVDNLNNQIFRELLTYMLQDPKVISRAIGLILVARNLERIADHATNIAEDVYYIVEGKDIRHHLQDHKKE